MTVRDFATCRETAIRVPTIPRGDLDADQRTGSRDVWVRGERHASDHAPAWIELASEVFNASKSKRRAD
jgi:hypothetical protein